MYYVLKYTKENEYMHMLKLNRNKEEKKGDEVQSTSMKRKDERKTKTGTKQTHN